MNQSASLPVHGSAVVTGASRGIGRAVALELAARGFDTVATMRDPAAGASMPEEAKGSLEVRRLDVTDPSTFELPGDLRVLVNNAGIDVDYLPVEHANVDDWRRLFETNVFGVVALTSAAIPLLRANAPGVVCTVSSSSIFASVPFYAAYRASKAAVSAFDDSLRTEVAPFGIRVVEILPGPVDTDMFRLSSGEQDAARFEHYRSLGATAARLREEHADPRVVDAADAAVAIVDAILESDGPMRYGCDPVSYELLELWRQHDDETVYELTGRSLLDAASAGSGAGTEWGRDPSPGMVVAPSLRSNPDCNSPHCTSLRSICIARLGAFERPARGWVLGSCADPPDALIEGNVPGALRSVARQKGPPCSSTSSSPSSPSSSWASSRTRPCSPPS